MPETILSDSRGFVKNWNVSILQDLLTFCQTKTLDRHAGLSVRQSRRQGRRRSPHEAGWWVAAGLSSR